MLDSPARVRYLALGMEVTINGTDIKITVEFPEPITDPAKLPKLRLAVLTPPPVLIECKGVEWKTVSR